MANGIAKRTALTIEDSDTDTLARVTIDHTDEGSPFLIEFSGAERWLSPAEIRQLIHLLNEAVKVNKNGG